VHAGFIGGETLLKLVDAGHDVLAIDRVMPPGHLIPVPCQWHTGDFAAELGLDAIKRFCPDAIVHCAGTSLVGPSVTNPEEYYNNNFVKTKILLDFLDCNHYNKQLRIVFSSSAATYGNPILTPCQEVDPCEPISPYGQSKLMIEWMLRSYQHAYGLDYVAFRYFNACGADSQGTTRTSTRCHTYHCPSIRKPLKTNQMHLLYTVLIMIPRMVPAFEIIFMWKILPTHIFMATLIQLFPAMCIILGTNSKATVIYK
jgi:UDP-glucose 4-epimerase